MCSGALVRVLPAGQRTHEEFRCERDQWYFKTSARLGRTERTEGHNGLWKTAVVCFYGEVQVQPPIVEQKDYKLQKIRSIKNYKATKATKYKLLCRGRKAL